LIPRSFRVGSPAIHVPRSTSPGSNTVRMPKAPTFTSPSPQHTPPAHRSASWGAESQRRPPRCLPPFQQGNAAGRLWCNARHPRRRQRPLLLPPPTGTWRRSRRQSAPGRPSA
jgi:hypothetical protein